MLVYGGDYPDIHGDILGSADPPDVRLLKDTKEFRLQIVGHGGYLIEEDRSPVRLFEKTCSVHGSRE